MSPDPTTTRALPGVRSGSLQAWFVATRPRSLLVALSPVLVGGTLGFARTGHIGTVTRTREFTDCVATVLRAATASSSPLPEFVRAHRVS